MNTINNMPSVLSAAYKKVDDAESYRSTDALFSDILNNAIESQAAQPPMIGISSLGELSAVPPGGHVSLAPIGTTGIENAIIAAAQSGEMADAQIALFMMFMMMMQSVGGEGDDFSPMMQMMAQMISQLGGDASYLHQSNMPRSAEHESGISRLVDIALSQVGVYERDSDGMRANGNFTKFGEWFGLDGHPWCAMFVSWVANEAGLLGDVIPKHASTTLGANAYMERGLYETRNSGYLPREGDTIFFYNPSTGRFNHVGIVVAFDPRTQRVYTVEGNTDNAVRIRHHDLSSPRIHGFGRNGGTGDGVIPRNSTSGAGTSIV
ncbi:MAG: CHAP domain-containing protein [Oscillospiraceae bacterium]|nr:CHAP domain-containing protein [Oscillospiraceae bacterium]